MLDTPKQPRVPLAFWGWGDLSRWDALDARVAIVAQWGLSVGRSRQPKRLNPHWHAFGAGAEGMPVAPRHV